MAAAYASVVTLMDTIKQIQHHPRPPISLNENQVLSLTQNLTFLQEFLEDYSHSLNTNELVDALACRITYAAHATEDKIESHVLKQMCGGFTIEGQNEFQICLQKLVDDMDLIKGDIVMEIIKETISPIRAPLQTRVSSSSSGPNAMVGFDDALYNKLMDKLTGQRSRQIISIVGMGGIGKTTLARNAYSKLSQRFDVCAWTTISQSYNIREILIDILSQVSRKNKEDLREKSDDYLKDELRQELYNRRYLIIMDDIWTIEVWDEIKLILPECDKGSRVVTTSRQLNFSSQVNGDHSYCLEMKFLDDEQSWNLFCKIVFGEEVCPNELEEIGKKIAKGCKGLPLSISVIGGLLGKSKSDQLEYWRYVAANLNSVVNSENNGECLKILEMSYSQLPIHLKPCFLHLGVFREDEKIRVSRLIELWVVEGFLKPICGKSMEVVAKEYFNELIDRHLILVRELGAAGNIKYCSIHDLLRDFCLREAKKERFFTVLKLEQPNLSIPLGSHRRVVIPEWWIAEKYHALALPDSTQLARSLYYSSGKSPPLLNLKFLRIWKKYYTTSLTVHGTSEENIDHLVHLRYLEFEVDKKFRSSFFDINRFWNLSTIIIEQQGQGGQGKRVWNASHIWKMPQLRHVRCTQCALDDPISHNHDDGGNDIILGNLQTLWRIRNFKCSEEVIKRIPNLKKLRAHYIKFFPGGKDSYNLLNNIERLCKLESFEVCFVPNEAGAYYNLTFPNSLKKLEIASFDAEELLEKISSLPHLVKLKLIRGCFGKREWVTVKGQFCNLRFLHLEECFELKCWITDSSHFPRLQRLSLKYMYDLNEIPIEIGEIPTLQSIHVQSCSDSVVSSVRKIQEEREDLQLHVPL